MSENLIIFIVFAYFAVFLLLGQHVATVLLATGFFGVMLWIKPATVISFIEADVFYRVETYSFITIPLYIAMAFFLLRGGVIKDVYFVIHRMCGQKRSPLAMSTVVIGGLLGAVSGSATAISAGLAVTAAPELKRYGFVNDFAVALGSVGGSLSALVPPSIIIIIYASISELSIGKMFMGAVIPGILLIAAFCLTIVIVSKFSKKILRSDAPAEGDAAECAEGEGDTVEKSSAAFSFVLVIALILVVFGGIYGGVMTATEAGAVAAFITWVVMMARRKIDLKSTLVALSDTARMTAMIMIIVIGAQFFGRFMSLSMLPRELIGALKPFMDSPYLIVAMLLVVLFLMGMILESAAVMVMIIPITDPIIKAIKVDPIWFGVVASLIIMLGLLTPPVGLAAYAAATAANISVGGVFKYTIIFAIIAAVVVTPFLFIYPEIVTYLPTAILK